MITSSSNAQVKNIIALNKKAKERREQDVFVAEGWKMFQEAPREWLKKVYVSESGSKMHEMPSDGTEYEVVDDRVFHVRHEDAAGCFKCDPHAALHRRGGDGQRKDTASDGT